MTTTDDNTTASDARIAQHFAALKRSELAQLPTAPSAETLLRAKAAAPARWYLRPAPSLALAASLLVAVLVMWQVPSSQPDAGELYADIMAGATFTTDAFLVSSHGIAPESISSPGVFDFSAGFAESVQ